MNERIDTVIIGGGHAGLMMSYYLSQAGREHVILERGQSAIDLACEQEKLLLTMCSAQDCENIMVSNHHEGRIV